MPAVKEQARTRIIDTVEAVSVFCRLDGDAEHHHRVDVAYAEFLRKRDLGKRLLFPDPEQHKSTGCRLFGKNAEVHTAIFDQCRPERQHPADPVLQTVYFICRKSVHQLHI